MEERLFRIAGWAGVAVGMTGVIPGIFLLRGSMLEFGLVLVLLGALVLAQVREVEELRHIRRGLARLVMRAEGERRENDSLQDEKAPVHQEAAQ